MVRSRSLRLVSSVHSIGLRLLPRVADPPDVGAYVTVDRVAISTVDTARHRSFEILARARPTLTRQPACDRVAAGPDGLLKTISSGMTASVAIINSL